jgi:ankyrin repeat protein
MLVALYGTGAEAEKTAGVLLSHGADPNIKDKEGRTPLAIATEEGHKGLVELLKQHGAKE